MDKVTESNATDSRIRPLQHEGRNGTWIGRYRLQLNRLEQAQKPGGGVPAYMRWVNRRAARYIAAFAAIVRLTPNGVTAMSALLSASGLALLVAGPQTLATGALVALLLALGFAFDSADGQLARLTGVSSPAGEWLDHVVDAIRAPSVHVSIAAAILLHRPDIAWLAPAAGGFAIVSAGQFTSQILAEQLVRKRGSDNSEHRGLGRSFILLPTDTGVLCWGFVLWGSADAFAFFYIVLLATNLLHAGVSMQRKYRALSAEPQAARNV